MKKRVLQISVASLLGGAAFLSSSAAIAKGKPGTIVKQVPGGSIKMTPVVKWDFLPKVVAKVGDKEITKAEFIKQAQALSNNNISNPAKQSKQLLNIILNKMLLLKIAENAGIKPAPELAKSCFQANYKKLSAAEKTRLAESLKKDGKSLKTFEDEIAKDKANQEDAAIKTWIEKNISNKIKVSQADIDKFYAAHKETLFKKSVRASHILIKPEKQDAAGKKAAKDKALKLLKQIKNKANFGMLAKQNSSCPSKTKNGDLGEFSRGQMVKAFEDKAFSMKVGEVSEPVETRFGYHIIKLTKVNYVDKKDIKPYIENILKEKKATEALGNAINNEKKKLKVKTFI